MFYYVFYGYAIMLLYCPIIAIRAAFRKDNDSAAVAVLLFFLSIIGLMSNLYEFARLMAFKYNIIWNAGV